MPRVSFVCAVWNTAHLLNRTLYTLTKQTYQDFEVVVIDDCSEDSVELVVQPYRESLDIKVHRLEHDFGMRGNTVSFNTGFSLAQGDVIFESTPEIMLYPTCIEEMVKLLDYLGHKSWVSVRTYNLTPEDQLLIDSVDWDSDIYEVMNLPNFNNPWTLNNTKKWYFGTHQTCAFYRSDWFAYWGRYPHFLDYGTDDPWNVGQRARQGIRSATIKPFCVHQWHAPIDFWIAHDKAPNWNRWGHSLSNFYSDPLVPPEGTAKFWDSDKEGGYAAKMPSENRRNWRDNYTHIVVETGFRRKDGRPLEA